MPIQTACPHCRKPYRLKDELAGKSVKCSGPECRKAFTVPAASANGSAPPKPKPADAPPIDAEALAARLFAEDGDQKAEERMVEVVCEVCSHKWAEPATKIGKMVLCPDCKNRQRIPEPKKKAMDWRDATKEGRKGPELPKDLAEQQMQSVSMEALKKGGGIPEEELEPRPLKQIVTFWAVGIGLAAALIGGGFWMFTSRTTGQENLMMATAVDEIPQIADTAPFPKGQPPMLRAALHIAAAEYHARQGQDGSAATALKHINQAKLELDAVPPPSFERDVLFTEVGLAVVALGGDAEQVKARTHLAWSPQASNAPPVGNTPTQYVQVELQRLLTDMQNKWVDPEVRAYTLRRLARELTKKGQPDLLPEVLGQAFADPEAKKEALAQVLLETLRAGAPEDKVKRLADQLRDQVRDGGEKSLVPPSAAALFNKLKVDVRELRPQQPQPGQQVSVVTLLADALVLAIQDKSDAAVKLIRTSGAGRGEQIQCLAVLADLSADPKPVLDAAFDLGPKDGQPMSLFRLTRAAAQAGQADQAAAFAKAIADPGLREWALAEALRVKWAAGKAAVPVTEAPKPADASKLRVGNAWGCLALARHNAAVAGDRGASKEYDTWGTGELRGFGYAGLALGLQDRK